MRTSSTVRRCVLSAGALSAALVLAACSGSGSVHVTAPAPTGTAARQCAALQRQLPGTLHGEARRSTSPASVYTAAWGDPAITLRCGVSQPDVMNPAAPTYNPTAIGMDLNGLCWVSAQNSDGSYRFTTVKQQTFIEVDVPAAAQQTESPLPGLTGPVLKTDPVAADRTFDCA